MKRSYLLAGAGAVLVTLLAATTAEAQTAGASATGVRTATSNQASQSNVRADTNDTVIASLVTGAIDGAAAEIADNSTGVAARGNETVQHLDADLAAPDGYGPTVLGGSATGITARGGSAVANRQTMGASVITDVFDTAMRLDAGQVTGSALSVSRNAFDATALGNDAAADVALTGDVSDSGAGIASYQGTGSSSSVAARSRGGTLLHVGPVSQSTLVNSGNLDRSTASGNSADTSISANVSAVVAPATSAAASTVPMSGTGDPAVVASFGVLGYQVAGGTFSTLSGKVSGDPVFGTVVDGGVTSSAIASDSNVLSAATYANRAASTMDLSAVKISDQPAPAPVRGAVANITNVQRAAGSTLFAYTFGGTAIDAPGGIVDSNLSASDNDVETVATANLASGNRLTASAGDIHANGAVAAPQPGSAFVDAQGGTVSRAAFGIANVQDYGASPITVSQGAGAVSVSATGAIEGSTVRVERNTARGVGTGNSAVNVADLAATSMRGTAVIDSVQTGNGGVTVSLGDAGAPSGARITTDGFRGTRLFVTDNSTTGTAIGSTGSNALFVSSGTVGGTSGPAASGSIGASYGAVGTFALSSEQKLGEPTAGNTLIPRIVSTVIGEIGASGDATDSMLTAANNSQRANALGNASVNSVGLSATALEDNVTSSLSSFQYGQANVSAGSVLTLTAPGALSGSAASLTGNANLALAAINDTDNSLSVDAATADGSGAGVVTLAAPPFGPPTATGDNLVANQQFAAGNVAANASTSIQGVDSDIGLAASRFTVSGNATSAEASANRARNAASLETAGDPAGIGVVNSQTNTAQASAAALTSGTGSVAVPSGGSFIGSSIELADNSTTALARGNAADNLVSVSGGPAGPASTGQARLDAIAANVTAPVAILNAQGNYGAVSATTSDTGAGLPLNLPGAAGQSGIGITGNSLTASAQGNAAANTVSLSALGQAPTAAIANAQTNFGNVSAHVSGLGRTIASGPLSGGSLSISGNGLAATAVGNQVTSAITTPR